MRPGKRDKRISHAIKPTVRHYLKFHPHRYTALEDGVDQQ